MKKVLLTTAIIASFGTTAVAQGIAPATTLSTQASLLEPFRGAGAGSLSTSQIVAVAVALGITAAVVVSVLNDETDGT